MVLRLGAMWNGTREMKDCSSQEVTCCSQGRIMHSARVGGMSPLTSRYRTYTVLSHKRFVLSAARALLARHN